MANENPHIGSDVLEFLEQEAIPEAIDRCIRQNAASPAHPVPTVSGRHYPGLTKREAIAKDIMASIAGGYYEADLGTAADIAVKAADLLLKRLAEG